MSTWPIPVPLLCLVCGEQVSVIKAPLHAEDHEQRGESRGAAEVRA